MIVNAFGKPSDHPEEIYLYVLCLENWLSNCPSTANEEIKAVLLEIGENLFKLKEVSNGKNRRYINRLILQEFYLFYPTIEKQIKFIVTLNDEELKEFLKSQSINEKKEKESIVF